MACRVVRGAGPHPPGRSPARGALRGRGGAGFSTELKWELCRPAPGTAHVLGAYRYLLKPLLATLQRRRDAQLLGHHILGQAGFDFDIAIHVGAGTKIHSVSGDCARHAGGAGRWRVWRVPGAR